MLTATDALLIVDVQRDFLPGGALAVPAGDEVVAPLAALCRLFAAARLPVVASRDWHPADHCSFRDAGGPWPRHCVAGSPGAELDPGLDLPAGARIVDKATTADKEAYSAFDGTDLACWLSARDVRRLFVGGLATEYCVLNTAADALSSGFEVQLVGDAIRAIDPLAGERAIRSLCDMKAAVTLSAALTDD